MLNSEPASARVLASLRRLLRTALGAAQNRAELLAVEFQEEKDQAIEVIIWLMAVLFFAVMAVLVLTATVILLFREEKRIYVTGGLAFIYLLGAFWSFLGLRTRMKHRPIPFSASVEELKKDREWLLK